MNILLLGPYRKDLIAFLSSFGDKVTTTETPLTGDSECLCNIDFIISYGYRHILEKDILDKFPNKAINFHISLLPWNRGADPNLWSFLEDTPKGCTIHYLDEGVDTGDIIIQKTVAFRSKGETLATTYKKLNAELIQLFRKEWPRIMHGDIERIKQPISGSVHRLKDKKKFEYLLDKKGWDTNIEELTGRAITIQSNTLGEEPMREYDYSEETRAVYHKQHVRIAEDNRAMQRFIGMFSTDYIGLRDDYFKEKKILDAGCGDTAKVIIALNKLGATDIHGIDIGTDFIPVAKSSLSRHDVPLESVTLNSANILKIPYESNYFDFVVCHGVLLHLNNYNEVETAFSELSRVLKPYGYLYTVYGVVGGLFEDAIFPAIRKYYRENDNFKKFIDNVSPEDFHQTIDLVMKGMEKYGGEKINIEFLKVFFDVDFSVFLQNFTQVPVRLSISEEFVRKLYSNNGLRNVRRLRRYVRRKNIRKFFAPLHYEVEHPISKILYGSGNLEFIGQKSNN